MLPVPTARGKGVLVSPTIYGNVMLGPTAEDLDDRTATGTSEAGFEFLLGKGATLMPRLLDEEVTASYAGLRAAIEHGDYLIEVDTDQRYVLVGGIRSTGLTASMAIAEHVDELLSRQAGGLPAARADDPRPAADAQHRRSVPAPLPGRRADRRGSRVRQDRLLLRAGHSRRDPGRLASPIPPAGLDGLRRRTRAMNGRCQGFYCGAEVNAAVEAHPCSRRAVAPAPEKEPAR